MIYNETLDVIPLNAVPLNIYKKIHCTLYVVLFAVFFITSICISSVFVCFYWYLKKDNVCVKLNPGIQTKIY